MKKTVLFAMAVLLCFGLVAQNSKKKKKKPTPKPTAPVEIALPERCSDCFFAVKLHKYRRFFSLENLRQKLQNYVDLWGLD